MLPDDPYFDAKDVGSPVPPGLVNALQRSVDAGKASEATGTFPSPTGTTLPWGGGKMVFFRGEVAADSEITADDSIDWRNRFVLVFGGFYDAAADLPGSGTEQSDQPGFDYRLSQTMGNWQDVVCGYLKESSPLTLIKLLVLAASNVHINTNAAGELKLHNSGNPAAIYPCLWIFVSDQFPART
jgi:hypothetical protein